MTIDVGRLQTLTSRPGYPGAVTTPGPDRVKARVAPEHYWPEGPTPEAIELSSMWVEAMFEIYALLDELGVPPEYQPENDSEIVLREFPGGGGLGAAPRPVLLDHVLHADHGGFTQVGNGAAAAAIARASAVSSSIRFGSLWTEVASEGAPQYAVPGGPGTRIDVRLVCYPHKEAVLPSGETVGEWRAAQGGQGGGGGGAGQQSVANRKGGAR